ncbi:MAG: hypothetical protein HKM93_07720 [Desulfobacteraceae bacterium]|nr:hypothetical protein [Desulfobacteraceae bacterium]
MENGSERFKISLDDEPGDNLIRSEIDDMRIEKLNHRMTLMSILIPCLVIVVLVVSYIDIKRRVITTQTSGSAGVQSLSKDLESRFSSLSVKQAMLEDQVETVLQTFEKNSASASIQLQKLEAALTAIKKESADKKTLDQSINRLETTITDVRRQTSEINAGMKPQFEKLDQAMAMLTEELNEMKQKVTTLSDQNDNISRIAAEKIDKQQLDLGVRLSELRSQEKMVQKTTSLEQSISAMQKELDALKLKMQKSPVSSAPSGLPPAASPTATDTPPSQDAASSPGDLVEQDIN